MKNERLIDFGSLESPDPTRYYVYPPGKWLNDQESVLKYWEELYKKR